MTAATALAGLIAGAAQAQVEVKIGVLNDRSGLYSDLTGEGSVTAAKMADEDFKAAAPNDSFDAALAEGHDVALWPGGEVDSLRPWSERDRANLAGRKGFVKMAIRAGVPIVPIATVGGADAMPVLLRGDRLSRALRLDRLLRLKVFPVAISLPWGIAPAALPQLPLPAKIRTRFMPAVEIDNDPGRAGDDEYVDRKYHEVQDSIQRGMDALARKRALPLFG